MNIHYISYFLSEDSMRAKEETFECTETKSGYKVLKQSTFGGKTTLVKTQDILKVDSLARTDIISPIHCYTWYLDEADKVTAKTILREYLITRTLQAKEEASKVYSTLLSKINQ